LLEKKYTKEKAVALQYDKEKDNAPSVTAQGTGETAKNIIKIAEENGIPIKKDEDLVNMLSQIELNKEIPVELYQAVSEVFSFIYALSNDKRNENNENTQEKES
jgi:flagellar biosynthesis protein